MIRTTFKITQSGLPIISAKMIDETATRMLEEFLVGEIEKPRAVDVDAFLREYLHMNFEERRLSHNGFILGMTVFEDTDKLAYWVPEEGRADYCSVKARTILVDSQGQSDEMLRFTKAHECGHAYFHNIYMKRHPGEVYCRESKETLTQKQPDKTGEWTEYQWREWQANTFASCLLMPAPMVNVLVSGMDPIRTGDPFGAREERIYKVSEVFRVSRTAAAIRLNGMGLLEEEEKTGYVFLNMGKDDVTGITYYSPYYDGLGNYIPERPLDPPEPVERSVTTRKRTKK